ncbi:hypothetical protein P153DRAFT_365073 [Dothidotthia symphoricarpi CBS 119687]|uniref:tRNA(Ile)-lysidine synthetase n=1 Tax=Dothidotthia symphoricarpi CBS 119687 TaxID=1392245 RepID=A0A6A6ALY8_9PLEO|nr:uncharacterized protein P153DRAFT_365073 [Dothidotthia symphoricarpi CBS 119687]KAF2131491.1 hypothetical protein P153DRAFT_365073 [Dothidotthia symphoricarpi CBS 119687]
MEATVIPLSWSEGYDIHDDKRFETDARTLRYQALGKACKANKVSSLLVAHHADDQAETVMMRIMNNRLRSGLQAMQSVEWIPECYGIYGVHHSGQRQGPDPYLDIPFPIERGGIRILRPLLRIEKSRLIATCEEQGVAWAEDKTNSIQTLTARNAIRHVIKNHKLPAVLNVKSLVDISLNMQKRVESHKAHAEKLFDQCPIKMDIQTGCLLVRFPPFASLLNRLIKSASDMNEAKNNAYFLVERVAELVTPKPKAPLSQLAGTIENIYPEFRDPEDELAHYNEARMKNYSVYSVWWRLWDKESPFEDQYLGDNLNGSSSKSREWLLTRQPLDTEEKRNLANQIVYPPAQTVSSTSVSKPTWQFFDGRYWIRLQNYSQDTLIMRIFSKEDLRHLPSPQKPDMTKSPLNGLLPERFITATFNLLKPSDVRFTLPAVFRKDSTTGEETLVGFPTLNVGMGSPGAPQRVCDWNVRYKKIDFGRRSADDIIVPGTSKMNIVTAERRQRGGHKVIKRHNVVIDEPNDPVPGYRRVSGDKDTIAERDKWWHKQQQQIRQDMKDDEVEGL